MGLPTAGSTSTLGPVGMTVQALRRPSPMSRILTLVNMAAFPLPRRCRDSLPRGGSWRTSLHSVIEGQRFDWRPGDFFAVPPWAWHEHANTVAEAAILFSMHDTPVFEALGLYREEAYGEHGGHQPVTSVFDG